MLDLPSLIVAARVRAGAPSEAQLSLLLKVDRARISSWRKGKNWPDDDNLVRLCELAGIDAAPWLMWLHEEKAHGAARPVYRRLKEAMLRAAVAAALALFLVLPSLSAAYAQAPGNAAAPVSMYYGKYFRLVRRLTMRLLMMRVLFNHARPAPDARGC